MFEDVDSSLAAAHENINMIKAKYFVAAENVSHKNLEGLREEHQESIESQKQQSIGTGERSAYTSKVMRAECAVGEARLRISADNADLGGRALVLKKFKGLVDDR